MAKGDSSDHEARVRFDVLAQNPERWRDIAEDLHGAARVLWAQLDDKGPADWMASLGKITLMLEGLARETLAKSFLGRRAPTQYVSGGKWSGPKHGLPKLAQKAELPCEDAEEQDLLARLAAFVT